MNKNKKFCEELLKMPYIRLTEMPQNAIDDMTDDEYELFNKIKEYKRVAENLSQYTIDVRDDEITGDKENDLQYLKGLEYNANELYYAIKDLKCFWDE